MLSFKSKKRRMSSRSNPSNETDQPNQPESIDLRSHTSENYLGSEIEYSEEDEENPLDIEDPCLFSQSKEKKEEDAKEVRNYFKQTSKQAEFWTQYKSYKDKEGFIWAKCVYCSKTFAADPIKNGTSNLKSHYDSERPCKMNLKNKTKGTQSKLVLDKINDTGNCKMRAWVLDQKASRRKLGKCIIGSEVPFTFVEKYEFKDFVASICPDFKMPSRSTIMRDCHGIYEDEKKKLKDYLMKNCQRVCFTTDIWTSIQNISYMTLTTHFIDNDWKLRPWGLLHKGDDIARELFDEYRSIYSLPSSEVITRLEQSSRMSSKNAAPNILKSLDSRLDQLDEYDGALYASEFDRYFHELRIHPSECEDVLTWWKLDEHRFLIMARLAHDVLAIPVTSVALESAFSIGGRTLDQFRSSLGYKTVEALICTQNWIRASRASEEVEVDEIQTLIELEQIQEVGKTKDILKIGSASSTTFYSRTYVSHFVHDCFSASTTYY